jgi:hypothetical protein
MMGCCQYAIAKKHAGRTCFQHAFAKKQDDRMGTQHKPINLTPTVKKLLRQTYPPSIFGYHACPLGEALGSNITAMTLFG